MVIQEAMTRTTPNRKTDGKMTSRACESCLKSRARWFCPADDAFLCHSCDSSVHSANGLAARHNRVPLQTASFGKPIINDVINTTTPTNQPTWHNGFQKKARTPRHHPRRNEMKKNMMMSSVVPEMSSNEEEEGSYDEEAEHMIFSVPTFEPNFDHEEDISDLFSFDGIINDHDHQKPLWDNLAIFDDHDHHHMESLMFEGTDKDKLIDCSSTVPSMISSRETNSNRLQGANEDQVVYYSSTAPYMIINKETDSERLGSDVKVEVEDGMDESSTCEDEFDFWALELENEVLMNNIEVGIMDNKKENKEKEKGNNNVEIEGNNKKILLRLNYEEVIKSWFGSSPWITGCRPQFDLRCDGWPNWMGDVDPMDGHCKGGGVVGEEIKYGNSRDKGREERVSRYREKRRTRLFSKKIRYQVRKLNAEKRPRLKGRFVKRLPLN